MNFDDSSDDEILVCTFYSHLFKLILFLTHIVQLRQSPQKESDFKISDGQQTPIVPPPPTQNACIHISKASVVPPELNATQGEASVGKKKKRIKTEVLTIFEDDGTEENELPPLNKKKRS